MVSMYQDQVEFDLILMFRLFVDYILLLEQLLNFRSTNLLTNSHNKSKFLFLSYVSSIVLELNKLGLNFYDFNSCQFLKIFFFLFFFFFFFVKSVIVCYFNFFLNPSYFLFTLGSFRI